MLELRDVWYWYEGAAEPAVAGVSLVVRPGERVVVLGRNGSGKSTLARLACGGLAPAQGEVVSDGYVGYVRQDPRDQLVSEGVLDEVAFGPCNLGWPRDEVEREVRGALAGSEHLMGRMTHELSGGEQQLVAVAGVRAMRPSCYVLDEAGAHLDVAGRQALADAVAADVAGAGVARGGADAGAGSGSGAGAAGETGQAAGGNSAGGGEMGRGPVAGNDPADDGPAAAGKSGRVPAAPVGVIEVTQDLGAVRGASAVVVMERGRVVFQGSAEEFLASEEARRAAGVCDGGPCRGLLRPRDGAAARALACEGMSVWRGEREVLRGVELELAAGLTLVVGAPGSGKTTLAQVLAGVLAPDAGTVTLDGAPVRAGQVGLAFQRPEDQLWASTVLDDIAYGPRAQGWPEEEALAAARAAAARLGVGEGLLGRSPFELSGGQMRRVALAGVVAARPGAYVFDEPTAGLDGEARAAMHELVADLVAEGAPVVVCTHDADEWRAEARAVVRLAGGVAEVEGAGAAFAAGAGTGEKVSAAGAGTGAGGASSPARARRRPPAPGAYVRGTTPVHRLDARVKLVALLVATVATFAASAPWGLVAAAAGLAVALAASRTSPATVLRGLRPAVLVLAFALVANSLVLVGGVGFSVAGLARTGAAVVRVVLVVGWVLVCSSTTMPPALADAAADLMRPLGRLGVPVGDVSMVVSVTLRFVPIAGEEAGRIRAAQAARGARLDEGGTIARLRGWTQVLVPLLVALFRRADVLAQAMVDRCYTGQGRTRMQGPLAPRDWAVLVVVLAWALAVALL